jgi:chlorobactene glucosyltransferase
MRLVVAGAITIATVRYLAPALWSLPWILPQIVTFFRLRNSRSLDDESTVRPPEPPLVSVVVPARNEAHNIERCVRSILTTSYPRLELIVVDDSSTDDTAKAARDAAQGDSRFRIVRNPPLPEGWFGKQWACNTGAAAARGEILLFTDADTHHAPDLVTRSINAMHRTAADMFSVAGRQEMGGFWEKLMQPQIFSILSMRYGGTESVNDSPRVSEKIANGQCIFFTRPAYDSIGGHSSVRSVVAEDLMLAQTAFARGKKLVLMLGVEQLSTRMYASLRELMEGWGKNVFAAGLDSVPFGRAGRAVFPLLLLAPPIMQLFPLVVLLLAAAGLVSGAIVVWAAIAATSVLFWWIVVYAQMGEAPFYALAYPLGAIMLLYLFSGAIVRGRRVTWKGRTYTSG